MADERDLTNADNLAANRRGFITDEQRREAARPKRWWTIQLVVVLALFGWILGEPLPLGDGLTWVALLVRGVLWAPAVAIAGWTLASWLTCRQAAAAGEVQSAEGRVVWRRIYFAAEFPGRVGWASNQVRNLLPGTYRFYYLPRSGYVLSAERAGEPTTVANDLENVNEVLEQAVGFGADDIERNRDGRLGTGEALRLAGGALLLIGLMLMLLGLCAFALWAFYGNRHSSQVLPLLIIGGAGLYILAAFGLGLSRFGRDVFGGRVAFVDGLVQRTTSRLGRYTALSFQVAGRSFPITPPAYEALIGGLVYRVYYTPHSKALVALESIGVAEAGEGLGAT